VPWIVQSVVTFPALADEDTCKPFMNHSAISPLASVHV